MMKKILPVAVATLVLVLSAGGAFAEAPGPATQGDSPGIDYNQSRRLPDADMAAVEGKGLRSRGCSLTVKVAGYILFGAATILRDPFGQGIGIGLVGASGAICA